jgi:SAM-dependent methyltransferase
MEFTRDNALYDIDYKSSTTSAKATLGTIEADISGLCGTFEKEPIRGFKVLEKFLMCDFNSVLDVGAGSLEHTQIFVNNRKTVDICDYGNSVYYENKNDAVINSINSIFIGDFNTINFNKTYDALWCCHILEHQLNVNMFLKKVNSLINEGGYLGIVVPPRKPFIVGGHVTLWNAGLLLYNLILAGFDCSEDCKIIQYDYNIGIIVKKKTINLLPNDLSMDKGDIEKLAQYFPFDAKHNFNGDIVEFNWN